MATQLLNLGHDVHGRRTHLVDLGSWGDWPRDLPLTSQYFCLLLAANGQDIYANVISTLASSAIRAGCAYLCAWGPECEFVHDVFDETYLGDGGAPARPTLMTSWHADQPLEEAIEFLCRDAVPQEEFRTSCRDVVVAVIANPEWSAVAHKILLASP
jgi:hypothetical protein